jgi:cytochrome P450
MRRSERKRLLPPGPGVPVWLQMLATWKRPAASLERLGKRYGKRITVQLPLQPPFVILSDPEEIKQLFTAPPDVLHPGEGARILEPLIGRNSVILLDEQPHLEQRKLMLPAFHGEKMQALSGLMEELAAAEVGSWPTGEAIALHERLQRLTLEIILRAVFGLDRGQRLDDLRDLLTEVLVFSESPLSVFPAAQKLGRWIKPLRRFQQVSARADRLIFDLIEERRADPEGDDVLAMLLQARHEDGSPMSAQEVRDELMTALTAGHETTASQLAWTFEQLARSPVVVDRLREDDDEYVLATIHEILRLRPVLPNAEPRLTKKPIRIGDWEYPPGVSLLASAFLVHHDPDIYPEPHAFRPERFLGKAPGTYTWIPFGGGRRRCLGASFALLEMRIVIRAVVERYELSPGSSRPEQTGRRSITFSPDRGASVILRERSTSAPETQEHQALAQIA